MHVTQKFAETMQKGGPVTSKTRQLRRLLQASN